LRFRCADCRNYFISGVSEHYLKVWEGIRTLSKVCGGY
jgi:hypothetical protein